uniref:Calponin-homology (CH) domain-containing protein n=1 Tax=Branchiostoma floridae TaxID=7739 RepID=C3YJ05_BRAFL|eukprot:XP_002603656.1 hypothetical protein BRAFLDRAFT_235581 [Branchiostoma floridae]
MAGELDEESLQELYSWIDEIPLSRPKKNITRDFSDGVMAAEIIRHFQPRMVDLHNYSPANSTQQKLSNWGTLNRKVFNKLNFQVPDDVMRAVCNCKPGVVEVVLNQLRLKIGAYMERRKKSADVRQGFLNQTQSDMMPCLTQYGESQESIDKDIENETKLPSPIDSKDGLDPEVRLLLEEKEQAFLASQETVHILNAKIRRLEHLLHLKDIRIEDLNRKLGQYSQNGHS